MRRTGHHCFAGTGLELDIQRCYYPPKCLDGPSVDILDLDGEDRGIAWQTLDSFGSASVDEDVPAD